MKPINQKDQTKQILIFTGIMLSVLLLSGFIFGGGVGVAKQQTEIAKSENVVLQDSLKDLEDINGKIQALITITDELDSLLDLHKRKTEEYEKLYKEGQEFADQSIIRAQIRDLETRIEIRKGEMPSIGFTDSELDKILFTKFKRNYDDLYLNARVQLAGISTGGTNKEQEQLSEIDELRKQLEAQQQANVAIQKDNQISSQASTITNLQTQKMSLETKVSNAAQIVAVTGPALSNQSRDIKQQVQNIKEYILKYVKGPRDRDDKTTLVGMLESIIPITNQLDQNAQQLNRLNAQLSN